MFQIVVLLVGTNNINNTAEEVAEGIFEIVKNIREKLPDAYIVLPVMNQSYSIKSRFTLMFHLSFQILF